MIQANVHLNGTERPQEPRMAGSEISGQFVTLEFAGVVFFLRDAEQAAALATAALQAQALTQCLPDSPPKV